MKQYWNELKGYLREKTFLACVLLIALICYGFAAANVTIGIDDLEGPRYTGSGNVMLAAGRFGTFLWSKLFYGAKTPYAIDIITVLLFIWAGINFCILFRRIAGNQISMSACTVFTCVFISYPLMNEIWEYSGLTPCGGCLLVSFSLLLIDEHLHSTKPRPACLILAALLMTLVCAGYESLVSVYIFFVFALLALRAVFGGEKEKHLKSMFLQGLLYAMILLCGLILRLVVHKIILAVMHLEYAPNGATIIQWGEKSAGQVLKYLLIDFVRLYILKAIIYFPLTELLAAFVAFVIIGIWTCRKYGMTLLLPGFGMLLSLIILSIVQGKISPYRTCQVFAAFVAFTALLLTVIVQRHSWKRAKWVPVVLSVLCCYLCIYQAAYLNYFLYWNHVRSEEEAYVIRDISTDLRSSYDTDKPVIFVGSYTLSQSVQEAASIPETSPRWQLYKAIYIGCYDLLGEEYDADSLSRKLPQSNVNSAIAWGISAYNQEGLHNLFAYYGYDYVMADYSLVFDEATAYVNDAGTPCYPQNGYIIDTGDYIIVNLH